LYKRPLLSQRKEADVFIPSLGPNRLMAGECLASKRGKKKADVFVPSLGPNRLMDGECLASKNLNE